ncbi:hypothetical protein HY638_04155 [Candidatus Woesearchaeota archaeon]|nr:hypothetical protein [Candidatus Woesearchaeota archaeon]
MAYEIKKPWENPFSGYHHATHDEGHVSHDYASAEKYHATSSELYNTEKGQDEKEEDEKEGDKGESIEDEVKKEEKEEDADVKASSSSMGVPGVDTDVKEKKKSTTIDEMIEKAIKSEKEVIHR